MTDKQRSELIEIIDGIQYGEILIKKEAGKIVVIKKTESVKLSYPDVDKFAREFVAPCAARMAKNAVSLSE